MPGRPAAGRARRAVHRTDLPAGAGATAGTSTADSRTGTRLNALATDRPIAGLLTDLKSRGLLDETLVIWAGEFGRTPMAQGSDGRDHNPFGFTIWMAGGGVKPGFVYGATDEYGYYAIENKLEIYDLHATMLHLLGHRPQAAHVPLQLPRHAADRRARPGGAPDRRLRLSTAPA